MYSRILSRTPTSSRKTNFPIRTAAASLRTRPHRVSLRIYNKQHVPSDSFGGVSPEKKASNALRTLFTFTAVKIILAQLEGSGRGSLGSYNKGAYEDLLDFVQAEPLRDGDEWVKKLMRRNSMLGLRVLEVRLAYCSEDFEFDQLEKLSRKDMREANVELMRTFAATNLENSISTLDKQTSSDGGEGSFSGEGTAGGPDSGSSGSRSGDQDQPDKSN